MNPVISVECDEPQGKVVRSVYPMVLDRENLLQFWEKSKKYPTLFATEIKNDFSKFVNLFVADTKEGLRAKGLLWRVDDFVGVFYMTDIEPEVDAMVHFTFFDGRIRGRDKLAREMLKWAFNKYKFQRLSVKVPLYVVPAAIHFVERIGFKKEGRIRRSALFNNNWFDTVHYGILEEELHTNGREN